MIPALVPKVNEPVAISCYTNYSMLVNADGKVYGFGSNTKGRMGFDGEGDEDIFLPKEVPGLVDIKDVNCGIWHSLALDFNG